MKTNTQLPFITLLLMISFASVNAVLFTPALPAIAHFFSISEATTQQTLTWFLIGYAIGQLMYGPLANRFGRKPTLYGGIILQIMSSFLCIFAGTFHSYFLLIIGRFFLALGSAVGLKMTFTMVNETHEPAAASQKLSYLIIAFAITPGLGVMLGGFLIAHFAWVSTFYAGALYGIFLLLLVTKLPETKKIIDIDALKLNHLLQGYASQFKNFQLITGGLLMSGSTCFAYVFAALAPFVATNLMHMSSELYGIGNLLPPVGLVLGSLLSAELIKYFQLTFIIGLGILIAFVGSMLMLLFALLHLPALIFLFIPLTICYFGLALVFANVSALAMSKVQDKAHGSAVMNFINIGLVTLVVLGLGLLPIQTLLMPIVYIIICSLMLILYQCVFIRSNEI